MSIESYKMYARSIISEPLIPYLKDLDEREAKKQAIETEKVPKCSNKTLAAFTVVVGGAGTLIGAAVGGPPGAVILGSTAAILPAAVAPGVCCDRTKLSSNEIFENRVHRLSGKVSEIDSRMKGASSREIGQLRKARDFFQNNHSLALRTIEVKHTHYHV